MTRKDYIRIAEAIKQARVETKEVLGSAHVLNVLTRCVADQLAGDNFRFDAARFYTASMADPNAQNLAGYGKPMCGGK